MKKTRKRGLLLIAAAVILLVAALAALNRPERKITSFVLSHQADLLALSTDHLAGDSSVKTYQDVQVDGCYDGEHPIVQFLYRGTGLAPSSKYYGFYYSQENVPAAYQNVAYHLTETGDNAWSWTDGTDNGGVTKRISDGWFYYEAWF